MLCFFYYQLRKKWITLQKYCFVKVRFGSMDVGATYGDHDHSWLGLWECPSSNPIKYNLDYPNPNSQIPNYIKYNLDYPNPNSQILNFIKHNPDYPDPNSQIPKFIKYNPDSPDPYPQELNLRLRMPMCHLVIQLYSSISSSP